MFTSDQELLRHIQEEIEFVRNTTTGKTKEEVVNDPMQRRAIIRSLEIIGEAAKKLSVPFKTEHAQIEWRKIAGTRDKLIHDYIGVDYDIVWSIVSSKLPELQWYISEILKEEK